MELRRARDETRPPQHQREVAAFITNWLTSHDVRDELHRRRAKVRRSDRSSYDAAAAVILTHLDSLKGQPSRTVTQASVSKWEQDDVAPSPDKWLAVADYLQVPLWEVHDMRHLDLPPQSARRLRDELRGAREQLREERAKRRRVERTLVQAEEALLRLRADMAAVVSRVDVAERDGAGEYEFSGR